MRRNWRGFASQHVALLSTASIEFAWTGDTDYLAVHDIKLTDGETSLSDAKPRRLLDLQNRMTFAPRGTTISGWSTFSGSANSFTALFFQTDFLGDELGMRAQTPLSKPMLYFDDPALLASMRKLRTQLAAPDGADAAYTETLALLCSLELGHLQGAVDYRKAPRSGQLSRRHEVRLLDHIEGRMHLSIGLDELASLVGLSRFHFVRAFKATFGTPPHQFLILRRVDRAMGLLRGSDVALIEIARVSGFGSQQQFTTVFRKVTGFTPGQYRRHVV